MNETLCKFGDGTPVKAFGMCHAHYERYQRGDRGDRLSRPFRKHKTFEEAVKGELSENRLKVENRELKHQLSEALNKQVFDSRYQEFVGQVTSRPVSPPEWIAKKYTKAPHEVMPTVSFSDWHLDEVVFPEQIQGMNGYNREIAERRLRNFFQNTIDVCFKFLGGFTFPGLIMPMLGDNFSGNIHEELRSTNADVIMSSILHWTGPMVAGIRMLATAFGHVYIPVVVGNHGRNSLKPINKMRVRDNFDWLWAQMVARELADDPRVTFNISESPDFTYTAYNTTYQITHGDQAKGGTGIAAKWSPLMLLAMRKLKRTHFDYLICGHWHSLGQFQKIRCNGCGKGYDEYAFNSNFDYEPPKQDLWLTDYRHGIVGDFPVHVASRDEPWMKEPAIKNAPYQEVKH
jgi:hypothetical protein